jgi:hypothetical protein
MSGGADMDLWGYVASEGDGQQAAARLAAIAGVGRVTNHATVMAPPLCRALDVLFEETAYADPGQAGPVIDRGGEKGVYQEGETLNVSVTPMLDGYLYVDYIDGQGHYVMHLLPNDFRPDNRVQANRALAFGTSAKEREAYAVGPPFGTNLVIAVLAPQPLFGTQRQFREPAEAYLTDLRQRLHALGAEGQRNRLLASKGVLAFVPR